MILHEATVAQIAASAPGVSAWVAANAGSGKTSVLTRRVARLLLEGCRPERILCLTYTRAAAAEMQSRLFEMLGEWALQEDAKLSDTLAGLGLEGAPELARARRLFAQALETPGGLKIQTIHAFCASLLRRFPLEAGAPPDFAELDDRTQAQIVEEMRDRMAEAAERGEGPFDAVADRASEMGMGAVIRGIFSHRDWFPEDAEDALREAFGIAPGETFEGAARREFSHAAAGDYRRLADALAGRGVKDQALGADIRPVAEALEAEAFAAAAEALIAAGHTKGGDPRKFERQPTKAVQAAHPWANEALLTLGEQAVELKALRNAHECLAKSLALHRFARDLLARYAAEKARRGALDFEDLVRIAGRLLTTGEMAAWALWKLDGGLDHILIDEAQDTSPDQWRLIRALAEEFLAGEGARDAQRTVFAVGDEKQSIYSFQGAEPREFGRMRDHFRARLAQAEGLTEGSLAWSFRSAPAILRLVDEAFADAPEGLSADGAAPAHRAFQEAAPGRVELWPLLPHRDPPEEPEWFRPVDLQPPTAPVRRLAQAVAARVEAMIRTGEPIPTKGGWRPMRPGDVMILLRKRKALAKALVDELKARGVAVAGADRLQLMESLAVRDLMSLLRVALDPGDDLSAAEVMRSPLGLVSEEGLFELAHGRGRTPLVTRLKAREADFPVAAALLADIVAQADYERPFELLVRALAKHGGRARIRARMSPEEEDATDELLAQALAYEQAETPTLAGFLAWMEAAGDLPLKRDLGAAGDAVRVMTVHGAKGLEAPFVILADAGPGMGQGPGEVLGHPRADGPPVAMWSAPKAQEADCVSAAKGDAAAREDEEALRLLYVALTRARSRLLVCGVLPKRGGTEGCWHERIAAAMTRLGAEEAPLPEALSGEEGLPSPLELAERWEAPAVAAQAPAAPAAEAATLPSGPLPRPEPRPRRVSASALDREGEAAPFTTHAPSAWDRETARRRGDAIHLLLEVLPEDPSRDPHALLATAFPELGALAEGCVQEARAALAHPDVQPFLAPEALAEAGLSAPLPGGLRLTGRVDRLLIGADRIRLLDWKTGPAPEAPPEAYLRQMAGYREALRLLHPGLPVEASLFWTAAGRLDVLEDQALDEALARLLADPVAQA